MALNKALLAQLAANTEGVDQTVATQNEGGNFSPLQRVHRAGHPDASGLQYQTAEAGG